MKQRILPVILAIGMAVSGLLGCGSTLGNPGVTNWIPPDPIPATTIKVFLTASAKTSADINGVVVKLLQGTTEISSQTVSATTDTTTLLFNDLEQGAYVVYIEKANYTRQSIVVSLSGSAIPVASFLVKQLVTTPTVTVGTPVAIVPSAPTVATVEAPTSVTSDVVNDSQVEVTLPTGTGVTGNISLVSQTGTETPPVVDDEGDVTATVLGAVEINVGSTTGSDTVQIAMPLPIDLTDAKASAGQTVNLMVFDPVALTWAPLGDATINADGLAVADVQLTGTNTLVAVAATPDVKPLSDYEAESAKITESAVKDMLARGETEYTFDQDPSVSVTSSKLGGPVKLGKAALADPPGNLDQAVWTMIAPVIAKVEPKLANWITGGVSKATVALIIGNYEILEKQKTSRFNIDYKIGTVTKTYTVILEYTDAEVRYIVHSAGVGTAG